MLKVFALCFLLFFSSCAFLEGEKPGGRLLHLFAADKVTNAVITKHLIPCLYEMGFGGRIKKVKHTVFFEMEYEVLTFRGYIKKFDVSVVTKAAYDDVGVEKCRKSSLEAGQLLFRKEIREARKRGYASGFSLLARGSVLPDYGGKTEIVGEESYIGFGTQSGDHKY